MAYTPNPNNLLPVSDTVNLPLMNGWYSTVITTGTPVPPPASDTNGTYSSTYTNGY